MHSRTEWWASLGLSSLLGIGALFPYSSPVRDAVTEQLAMGYHWTYPWTYLLFAPFCSMADLLTVLSLKEMSIFLFYSGLALAAAPIRVRTKGMASSFFLVF